MILILSNKWDLTVDFVVRELRRRNHDFLRLNTEDLKTEQATITLPDFHLYVSKRGQIHDLIKDVRVIWNRRQGKPFDDVPTKEKPSTATQRFVNDQWYTWLEALQLLSSVTWINHPQANSTMENKIRQLWMASKLGFSIPSTLVSNDPDAVSSALKRSDGKMVAKALYSPLIEEADQDYFIFSNEVQEIVPDDYDQLKLCPTIFQEPLLPKIDYRVTVIGDTVFPIRIESRTGSSVPLDWRTEKEGLQFVSCTLPNEIQVLCREYVRQSELIFGALDLVEYEGKFFFLEINPNGEWGWLQKPHGLPIAETLCDLMTQIDAHPKYE